MDIIRAPDFRYIYANGYSISVNGQDVFIRFGIKDGPEDTSYEQLGIVMNPSTAKLLGILLAKTFQMIEQSSGTEIPVDQSKVQALENTITEAMKLSQADARPSAI